MGIGLTSCCAKKQNEGDATNNTNLPAQNGCQQEEEQVIIAPVEARSTTKRNSRLFAKKDSLIKKNLTYAEDQKILFTLYKLELSMKHPSDYGIELIPCVSIIINADHQGEIIYTPLEKGVENISDDHSITDGTIDKTSRNAVEENTKQIFLFTTDNQLEIAIDGNLFSDTWKFKKVKFIISNYQAHNNKNGNTIVIGEFHIPLKDILSFKSQLFEGKFPIRSQFSKLCGSLTCIIKYGQLSQKIEEENQVSLNANTDYFDSIMTTYYEFLDPVLRGRFQLQKIDVLKNITDNEKRFKDEKKREAHHISLVKEFREKIEYPVEKLVALLAQAILKEEHIVIYGILVFLIKKFNDLELNYIRDFVYEVSQKVYVFSHDFFKIAVLFYRERNYTLVKTYFYFMNKLVRYYLLLEWEEGTFIDANHPKYKINFALIFQMLLDNFGFLAESIEANDNESTTRPLDLSYEEIEELKEAVLWILSTIFILIVPNVNEKKCEIWAINQINSRSYTNCIKLISKPEFLMSTCMQYDIFSDSEIISLNVKMIRKSIQILLDDKNNFYLSSDNAKAVSFSLKDLILNDDKFEKVLHYIVLGVQNYKRYPSVFSNLLLILIHFCMDYKYPQITRRVLDIINVSLLSESFDLYRGNLKKFGKNINFLFYKLFTYITDINQSYVDTTNLTCLNYNEVKIVCQEVIKLFPIQCDKNKKYKGHKKFAQFVKKKDIKLHETLCVIGANLSKNCEAGTMICQTNCYFVQHLIEYFFEMNKDSITKTLEKYKTNKLNSVKLIISIIENSILMMDNLFTRYSSTKDFLLEFFSSKNLTKNKVMYQIKELIDIATTSLNYTSNKLKSVGDNFLSNFRE